MGYSPKLSNYGERSRFASPFACGSCVTSRDSANGELACRLCHVGNPALLLLLWLLLSSLRKKAFETHLFILSELLFDKILSRVPMRYFFSRGGKFIGRPLAETSSVKGCSLGRQIAVTMKGWTRQNEKSLHDT